jgi:hypothetical protein
MQRPKRFLVYSYLIEKSILMQRRANGKFMLLWKSGMLFLGKMTMVILPEESVFFFIKT